MQISDVQIIGVFAIGVILFLLWRLARRPRSHSKDMTVRVVGVFPALQPELWDLLTRREKQVSLLAARGLRNSDIAKELKVSQHTVESHIKRAYSKLGIHNRVELSRLLRDVEDD
jgi:DNA-binding CsgD family transcriptional regulator